MTGRRGDDLHRLRPGQIGRAVHGLDLATGPALIEQPSGGHLGDVAGRDPGHRLIERQDDRHGAGPERVDWNSRLVKKNPQRRWVTDARRLVERDLGRGQTVDLTDAVPLLRTDAALEHHPLDAVLGHRADHRLRHRGRSRPADRRRPRSGRPSTGPPRPGWQPRPGRASNWSTGTTSARCRDSGIDSVGIVGQQARAGPRLG